MEKLASATVAFMKVRLLLNELIKTIRDAQTECKKNFLIDYFAWNNAKNVDQMVTVIGQLLLVEMPSPKMDQIATRVYRMALACRALLASAELSLKSDHEKEVVLKRLNDAMSFLRQIKRDIKRLDCGRTRPRLLPG